MIIRLMGKEAEAKATTDSVTFTDVASWAVPYVAYAAKNGIAGGYNTTTFGAKDMMTAAQFLTMLLRVLSYSDPEDFTWDQSYDKALEVELITREYRVLYNHSNLFLRDQAVWVAFRAYRWAVMKTGGFLEDIITVPGRPEGELPTAMRPRETVPPDDVQLLTGDVRITEGPGTYINYINLNGFEVGARAFYLFTADGSDAVEVYAEINGKRDATTFLEIEAGVTYYDKN